MSKFEALLFVFFCNKYEELKQNFRLFIIEKCLVRYNVNLFGNSSSVRARYNIILMITWSTPIP